MPSVIDLALMFAPTVIVPLALSTAERVERRSGSRIIRVAIFAAALLFAGSFALEPGKFALMLAAPWFLVTVGIAACGVVELEVSIRRGTVSQRTLSIRSGMVFVVVGGFWAMLARTGQGCFGYSYDIVRLTGVHFHYAGFALPVIVGCVADQTPRQIASLLVWGVIIGVPAVGVGIVASPIIEVVAAIALASVCFAVAGFQLRIAFATGDAATLTLLSVASISLIGGMCMAMAYAIGEFTGRQPLDIPLMAATHGIANAFGFALCGLLGWRRLATPDGGA